MRNSRFTYIYRFLRGRGPVAQGVDGLKGRGKMKSDGRARKISILPWGRIEISRQNSFCGSEESERQEPAWGAILEVVSGYFFFFGEAGLLDAFFALTAGLRVDLAAGLRDDFLTAFLGAARFFLAGVFFFDSFSEMAFFTVVNFSAAAAITLSFPSAISPPSTDRASPARAKNPLPSCAPEFVFFAVFFIHFLFKI